MIIRSSHKIFGAERLRGDFVINPLALNPDTGASVEWWLNDDAEVEVHNEQQYEQIKSMDKNGGYLKQNKRRCQKRVCRAECWKVQGMERLQSWEQPEQNIYAVQTWTLELKHSIQKYDSKHSTDMQTIQKLL